MANQHIHTGFWIDHSQGPVLGATITLNAVWGSQLISAAALVVQFIGAGLWGIIAFGIHQYRASPNLREPDRQLQVLLRNTAGPDWAAWNIGTVVKQWWRKEKPAGFLKEAAVLEVMAIVVYAGFLLAGIFVGFITLNQFGSSAVLLKEGTCGFVSESNTASSVSGLNHININISSSALQYARSCYGEAGSEGAISCSVYPVPSLNYTVEDNTECPIPGGSACFKGEEARPITLTTKALDSHYDLGINAPAADRLTLQYKTTCAPLDYDFVDSFIKIVNTSIGGAGEVGVQQYHVGSLTESAFSQSYLFQYAPLIRYFSINVIGYAVNAFTSWAPHNSSAFNGWLPAAPFNESKTDLSIFFLTPNGITFRAPVQDPMFRTFDQPSPAIEGIDRYLPERSVYLLACGEEWQICNPTNNACTGFGGYEDIVANYDDWAEPLSLNSNQNATYFRVANVAGDSTLFSAVNGVAGPLLASSSLNNPTGSEALPNGQWKREVEGWFQAALAKIQYYQTVYVNIPNDALVANDVSLVEPDTAALQSQCTQQRVVAPSGYQSYSFFGIIFVAFFGLFVPGIAIALKKGHRLFPRWGKDGYKRKSYEREDIWAIYKKVSKQGPASDYGDGSDDGDSDERDGETVRLQHYNGSANNTMARDINPSHQPLAKALQ